MTKVQFRALYREFLFRLIDREVLSAYAQGDASKLLGQFAAILIFFSLPFALMAAALDPNHTSHEAYLKTAWGVEHSLIATTMLAVGLFGVLSWNSAFPDRRDVLVLAPLPVRTSTILLAKVASLAMALVITVVLFNALPFIVLLTALTSSSGGFLAWVFSPGLYRTFAAYSMTIFGAGLFIFCSVLAIQGLAAQLPRRVFLRLSAVLQLAAFCLFVSVYFLQPAMASPDALSLAENHSWLLWLPSYWFLGLFQQLNGSLDHAARSALSGLAIHAWIGLAIAVLGAGLAFLLAYVRTLRRIVEEPDIMPGAHCFGRLPRFGNSLETAVVQFSIRTVLRSRQHRVILSFYAGIGFAVVILFMRTPVARQLSAVSNYDWQRVSLPLIASSFVVLLAWLAGMRAVCAMPLELRANWIFRVTSLPSTKACLRASRRVMYVLGLAPVWIGYAVVLLVIWPWYAAAEHIAVLVLVGATLAELWLHGFHKIPFTCSFLPGKSNVHITFCLCLNLGLIAILEAAQFERRALANPVEAACMFAILIGVAIWVRRATLAAANSEYASVRFEEEQVPAIVGLDLHRDGVLTIDTSAAPARLTRS